MNEFTTQTHRHNQSDNVASDSEKQTSLDSRTAQPSGLHQQTSVDWHCRTNAIVPYQLLPTEFLQRQVSRRIVQLWSAIVFILLTSVCGLSSSYWSRSNQASSIHAELIARSEPVRSLQSECVRLQQENKTVGQWIDVVNSAKPDDSVLQVLLAIAESASQSKAAVSIESIDVKLPLEHPIGASRPKWAEPKLTVKASLPVGKQKNTHANASMDNLTQTLLDSKRAASVRWQKVGDQNDRVNVQINGQPIATRMVP